ncbi:TetR/AcrR family transcriptional regulator [Xanthobacter oligotrophicus]|uniref:TetR/AcrR family transcriptional regulator n=1 Tax=Xanthobacter oligotrophicus TaxID=2607286 RepID=UPI00165DDE7E|nr:TetR/AcrR family transcriptional regulator [Xanthobacter oligotrophicus]MCG5236093.1 TetR family transcriptional regulator [Xanthobacter oligotrophicus]
MKTTKKTSSAMRSASPSGQGKGARRSAVAPGDPQRPDRRQDILASAEFLFAERGYAAVSVRDIAARAGVPVALVGYYFGRKPELLATVFAHRQANLDERISRIREIGARGPGAGRVEEIVAAWAEPVVRLHGSASGDSFSLLVARTAWDPGPEATEIIERFYDPLVRAFLEAMAVALPDCPQDRLLWAYEYAVGALLMYVADKRIERLSEGRATAGDPGLFDDFVRFVTAGLNAMCGCAPPRSMECRA